MTGVVLGRLEPDSTRQMDLFQDNLQVEKPKAVDRVVDAINRDYGKHKIGLGTGLFLGRQQPVVRDEQPWRKTNLLAGETARRRLGVPRWDVAV